MPFALPLNDFEGWAGQAVVAFCDTQETAPVGPAPMELRSLPAAQFRNGSCGLFQPLDRFSHGKISGVDRPIGPAGGAFGPRASPPAESTSSSEGPTGTTTQTTNPKLVPL